MNKPLTAHAIFLCFLFTNSESILYDCFRSVSTLTGSVLIQYLVELCKSQALPISSFLSPAEISTLLSFPCFGTMLCLLLSNCSIRKYLDLVLGNFSLLGADGFQQLVSRSVTILHAGNQRIPEESQVERLSFQGQAAAWVIEAVTIAQKHRDSGREPGRYHSVLPHLLVGRMKMPFFNGIGMMIQCLS